MMMMAKWRALLTVCVDDGRISRQQRIASNGSVPAVGPVNQWRGWVVGDGERTSTVVIVEQLCRVAARVLDVVDIHQVRVGHD